MSIKSMISVAVILGLTCVQAQSGPKRQLDPQAEPRSLNHRDDMSSARRDIQASERVRREWEAQSRDDGDPNKGWAYDVLFMRRTLRGTSSTVYPTHYGVYASKEECEQARVERINGMESDPNAPNEPVRYPVQAWYSETGKQYEQRQTQSASSGEVQSTRTGQAQVSGSGELLQNTRTGQPQVSILLGVQSDQTGQTQASSAGGTQSTTERSQTRGGDQYAMLFKHCVPVPNMKGPGRPGGFGTGRRAEHQQ